MTPEDQIALFIDVATRGMWHIFGKTVQLFRILFSNIWLCISSDSREDRTEMTLMCETIVDDSSPFEELHEDCILHIARLLDNMDRRHLTQTCTRFQNVILARSSPAFETRQHVEYVEFGFDANVHSGLAMNCIRVIIRQQRPIPDQQLWKQSLKALISERDCWPMELVLNEVCSYWMVDNLILAHTEQTPPATRPEDACAAKQTPHAPHPEDACAVTEQTRHATQQEDAAAVANRKRLLALVEHAFTKLNEAQSITLRLHTSLLQDVGEGPLISAFLGSTAKLLLIEAPSGIQAIFIEQEVLWGAARIGGWELVTEFPELEIVGSTLKTWQLRKGAEQKSIGTFFPSHGRILQDPSKVPLDAIVSRFRWNVGQHQ